MEAAQQVMWRNEAPPEAYVRLGLEAPLS